MSCGCGNASDNHGDNRNITRDDLNRAAQAAGINPQQAAQNIVNTANTSSRGTDQGRQGQQKNQQR